MVFKKENSLCVSSVLVWSLHTSSSLYKDVFSIILTPYIRDDFSFWLELDSPTLIVIWIFWCLLPLSKFALLSKLITFFELFLFPQTFLFPSLFFPFSEVLTPSVISPLILIWFFLHTGFPILPFIASYLCSHCWLTDRLLASLAGPFHSVSSGPATNFFLIYSKAFQV